MADKEQVAKMLQRELKFETIPKNLDATDGLAAAICHFYQGKNTVSGSKANSWSSFIKNNKSRVK